MTEIEGGEGNQPEEETTQEPTAEDGGTGDRESDEGESEG